MKAIAEKDWIPAAGYSLETNADKIVRNVIDNALVVAGPGAGKTELLAQRACFLLQTNSCKFPKKILAISFKKDAAYTLKERVVLRVGGDLANRFDSFTYDSFAKQILDRFKSALPAEHQIPEDYQIIFDKDLIDLYKLFDIDYVNTNDEKAIASNFSREKLSVKDSDMLRVRVRAKALKDGKLTFPLVMRLAESIIETNPQIKDAVKETYQYVFFDEFQDTTSVQYDFLKTCFDRSERVLTAVGDDKQRIMGFAGARPKVFEEFQKELKADRVPLKMNFRSAPILVDVQNSLIKHLLDKTDFATASSKYRKDEGECLLWEFSDQDKEADTLSTAIASWIKRNKINPRDVCVLVRASVKNYVSNLIGRLQAIGINARDEGSFQIFLTEEATLYLLHMMFLLTGKPKEESNKVVFDFLSRTNNEMSDKQLLRLRNRIPKFIQELKNEYKTISANEIKAIIKKLVDYADEGRIAAMFPQYRHRSYLNKLLSDFEKELIDYLTSNSGIDVALDRFYGSDTVPIMTVHKSKGLEYHSVIFVGLEDGAFWSFDKNPDDEKANFFVALSRAKLRVVFTFCKQRRNLKYATQTKRKLDILFKELERAGASSKSFG